jgi:hypothetical protein
LTGERIEPSLSTKQIMTEDTARRAHDLVEELRAEIDFEIDDVVAQIIRDLPDDYFRRLKREDQLKHLKTLLAISICHLDQEIVLRSEDGRHVAVIARQDYPGLLAKILQKLPNDRPLVEATIFSSRTHNFIIDLFEFETAENPEDLKRLVPTVEPHVVANTIDEVSAKLGVTTEQVAAFVEQYPKSSQTLESPEEIAEHYSAHLALGDGQNLYLRWNSDSRPAHAKLTIATRELTAREVFQRAAEFFAERQLDIEEAFLNDLTYPDGSHASISSFEIDVEGNAGSEQSLRDKLSEFLRG